MLGPQAAGSEFAKLIIDQRKPGDRRQPCRPRLVVSVVALPPAAQAAECFAVDWAASPLAPKLYIGGCEVRTSATLNGSALAVPVQTGIDRSGHLGYIESAAQKLVHFLSGNERIGDCVAVFYH
jgi:hypothetical protein